MIIQREIEAFMLAIDKLVVARIGIFDAKIGTVSSRENVACDSANAVEFHQKAADAARIEICDTLKDVIRTAVGGRDSLLT